MSDINIKGSYKFKQKDHIIYQGDNLITFYGVIYFLNRCVNDNFNAMSSIQIGNGLVAPSKYDISLGNFLTEEDAQTDVIVDKNIIKLTASFEAKDIIGVSEIGVSNGNMLISHDTFEEINSDMLVNPVGTVEVEYTYHFSTSTIRSDWIRYGKSIYWIYEPNNVIGVYEEDTGTGYHKVNSQTEVLNETNTGSYYYDNITKNLYVHLRNDDMNAHDILIQTR